MTGKKLDSSDSGGQRVLWFWIAHSFFHQKSATSARQRYRGCTRFPHASGFPWTAEVSCRCERSQPQNGCSRPKTKRASAGRGRSSDETSARAPNLEGTPRNRCPRCLPGDLQPYPWSRYIAPHSRSSHKGRQISKRHHPLRHQTPRKVSCQTASFAPVSSEASLAPCVPVHHQQRYIVPALPAREPRPAGANAAWWLRSGRVGSMPHASCLDLYAERPLPRFGGLVWHVKRQAASKKQSSTSATPST